MKNTKHLILAVVAVFLITATIFTTIAYLTSKQEVKNTFTVGNVVIGLDEALVKTDGTPDGDLRTEIGNQYHLLPGMSYTKDPTVTVKANSEDCYVRMVVTVTHYAELKALRGEYDVVNFFKGIDASQWITDGIVKENLVDGTATIIFTYVGDKTADYETYVPQSTKDTKLAPLFTEFTVPSDFDNAELEVFEGMEVLIEAHAIQATGFDNAIDAWAAFDAQYAD
ncbi:MAG: hypothetical protein IJW34_09630 [Clostridia bacterium]|nr:hypothetical protein [Clostridia bacterium]